MSADTLRRAAALLRERAEDTGSATMWFDADVDLRNALRGTFGCYDAGNADVAADARWIATMHPGVGLALADWLDTAGADLWAHGPLCECGSGCHECDDSLWQPHARRALALARLILGEVAS